MKLFLYLYFCIKKQIVLKQTKTKKKLWEKFWIYLKLKKHNQNKITSWLKQTKKHVKCFKTKPTTKFFSVDFLCVKMKPQRQQRHQQAAPTTDYTQHQSSSSQPDQPRYACNLCGKSYASRGTLGRHCRYECPFTGTQKKFHCPHCNFYSKRKDNLKCHIITHLKKKERYTIQVP